ncbi:hypothetical protein C0992_006219, partial [Termitomyces sp. T32_za158]
MPNLQKSKHLSVKKVFNNIFSSGSRSPSRAPSRDNVGDTGPQRTEGISATAPNANLASANDHLSQGTGDVPSNQAPAGVGSYMAQESSGQEIAWHGAQLFLIRFAKVYDHDPVKIAANLAVVLIGLGNAIADSKDALKEVLYQIESRLEVVNSASMQIGVEKTEFRMKIGSFAQLLCQNILELKTMSERSTWKVILESDEDKAKIEKILKKIDHETKTLDVFWLTGHAGSGKSTIAYSVAKHFDNGNNGIDILQASFFCSRQFEDTRSRVQIIPTLVYQLAHNSKTFAQSLFDIDRLDSAIIQDNQMKDLLADPWCSAHKTYQNLPPYLVVIDALDEIQNGEGSKFLKELLETVETGALHGLKFLVTSRPNPKIAELCQSFSSEAICKLYDIAADEVNTDILTYLKSELPKLQQNPDLDILVQKANGLFIYASTAVKYLRPKTILTEEEQSELLNNLTHASTTTQSEFSANSTKQIDILYSQILFEVFVDLDFEHIWTRLKILCNVLCAEERISGAVAAGLLNSNNKKNMEECSDSFIEALHAVLYVKDNKVF